MTDAASRPQIEQIEQLTETITLKNASSKFNLDDRNLTKLCVMAQLKQRMTRVVNYNFVNLTKNIVNQKDSNLCVPISVSVLLRWAIKNDLKVNDFKMERYFTIEKILTQLTMIIYPRSLAGMNLNPINIEKEFQHNKIELLLKRIKNETYLNDSGWDIIRDHRFGAEGSFDYNRGKDNQLFFFPFKQFSSPPPHLLHAHASSDCNCRLLETKPRFDFPPNDSRPR